MNKLIIAIAAGYLLGNEAARNELNKTIKIVTGKTIDVFNSLKDVDNDVHASDQLYTPPEKIPQEE